MEEDAGKLVHDEWEDVSIVDYNRSGVPLIEIVSEPDMRSAEEVIAYLETLRQTIQYLGASDCKLNEGSMRADVNISVREVGAKKFGTRTEMKNLNSFKAIAHAIEGERERQIELLEMGRKVVQETRRWDDNKESSHAMRSKEDAQDYRYFPEPDLVPIVVSDEWIAQIKAKQPELRPQKLARYKKEYDINGSLFLQADCKVSESRNLIIYGHNMNSGAMFGNLDLYADETYYQEHPFAYLQTEDSIQEYRIVTVLKADRNLFPFQQKLADAEAVQEYLKAAKQREVFETGDDYLKCIYDKVLTLVTCSYEWSGARNIVLAVPVSGAVWSQKCS